MKRAFFSLLLSWVLAAPLLAAPRKVTVVKDAQGWQLEVDGRPFFVKGVGCNRAEGEKGEDYLGMARDMGANAVRTWGDAPRSYLDRAEEDGLMVDLGIWLNPIRGGTSESYTDPGHREGLKNMILAYVREMKDHPALLTWNIGNEVFAFTDDQDEKKAFGQFLEEIVKAVHQEDPNHPVVYSSPYTRDLPYLKEWVPDLDIVGVNVYGAFSPVASWLTHEHFDKPLLATEFGPLGGWDLNKDKNDVPYDPPDQLKASDYLSLWRQIEAVKGRSIGGFAFVLGDQRNQDSLTWCNINFGELKRQSYWTLYQSYTGKKPEFAAPKITQFEVENSTGAPSGSRISVKVTASAQAGQELKYSYFITGMANDPLIVEPPKYYPVELQEISPGVAQLKVPDDPNIYRVYAAVSDTHGSVAIANRSIRVLPR